MARPKHPIIITVFGVLFWSGVGALVVLIRPESVYAVVFFLLLLFIALSLTFGMVFGHIRRGIVVSAGIVSILVLRLLYLDTVLNLVLLVGFLSMVELYFSRSPEL